MQSAEPKAKKFAYQSPLCRHDGGERPRKGKRYRPSRHSPDHLVREGGDVQWELRRRQKTPFDEHGDPVEVASVGALQQSGCRIRLRGPRRQQSARIPPPVNARVKKTKVIVSFWSSMDRCRRDL